MKPQPFGASSDESGAGLLMLRPAPHLALAPARKPMPSRPSGALQRRKLWDIDSSLHCSIIGTCLTTGELRALVKPASSDATDHQVHTQAVRAAEQGTGLARDMHKALDRRYRVAIKRFAALSGPEHMTEAWEAAVKEGDIPGAYWAVLTHPCTTDELVRRVFGHVHMLSHLVGAASRTDIRRLREPEAEKAALEEKLARQQKHLHEGMAHRDARIRELSDLLSSRIEQNVAVEKTGTTEIETLRMLVATLRKDGCTGASAPSNDRHK
jgi:hypothetical protein